MITMKNLEKLPALSRLAPDSSTAYSAFDQAALAGGAIPVKYKELMAVAVALTTQCAYCIEIHRQAALRAGVNEQELSEAVFVAAALRAGAAVTHGLHLLSGRPEDAPPVSVPQPAGQEMLEGATASRTH